MKIIIPARGGSKRIPKKNLIQFCGKPLVAWSIEQGLAVTEEVYVSTDDSEIEQVSLSYGAKVIRRPPEFAHDTATLEDVLYHVITNLDLDTEEPIVVLQPTSPLRLPHDIPRALEGFKTSSVVSANLEEDLFLWQNDTPVTFTRIGRVHGGVFIRENGSIYITKPSTLAWNRYGWRARFYLMEKWQQFEIDKHEDIEICEFFMEKYVESV